MTTVLASVVSCILAAQPANAHLANGLYVVSESGQGTSVDCADNGRKVVLGKLASAAFGKASLRSVENDNSKFRLDLVGAGPFSKDAEGRFLAVYTDGLCTVARAYSDGHADHTVDFYFDISSGTADVERIGKALGVKPSYRHHPGHQLLVTWHPVTAASAPGQPVVLRMEIKNVGKVPVSFMDGGSQRGPRNNQFGFMAYGGPGGGALPDVGSPMNFGGLAFLVKLPPGKAFTKDVDITDWFRFKDKDQYRVTCLYRLGLTKEGVTYDSIWDDYAVGDCVVRIVAPAAKPKP